MRKPITTTAVLTLAALALTGGLTACSVDGGPPSADGPATPQMTMEAPAADAVVEEEEAEEVEESAQDQLSAYGETWEYDDGIAVTVSTKGQTVAGEYAFGANPGDQVLLFEVTITNNGTAIFDPTMASSTVNYDSTSAERVFDGDTVVFEGKILPGASLTETQAFAIPNTKATDVLYMLTPDFEHEEALFFGSITPKAGA
ncbi:hypothetical protein [Arthrobacter roseus]|uniref:hypothetical protein n=1 Tax=Arthrobacter roseus TaxID=136274 RepID=UPI00196451A9|nr:hypothetical protein [Arthrobacter roseus]MBM7846836.1 hypothetical protein [Arthrobacter roseus]